MKLFKSSAFWVFFGLPALAIAMLVSCHTTPHRYVGTVIKVSGWNNSATLKTKTEAGKDTTIHVTARKYETFDVGQTITVWTGGNLIGGTATTEPQH